MGQKVNNCWIWIKDIWEFLVLFLSFLYKYETTSKQKATKKKRN